MPSDIEYLPLVDNFTGLRTGEPYRLLPLGRIVKDGKVREITPDLLRRFRLPHFKPPMKMGSHEDAAPSGGSIVALEVRSDGLYGIPEYTPKGDEAITEKYYRYHSPEVVWEGGGFEDPNTGEIIEGPLIVGDAWLHTPHLGEAAALYEAEPVHKESNMTTADEMVSVPKSLMDRFNAWLDSLSTKPEPQPDPAPEPAQTEEYTAALKERDEYRAKIEAMEAEAQHGARVEKFEAELDETKIAGLDGAAEMLAGMTDEQAEWTLKNLRALSEQVDGSLESDLGAEGDGEPVAVGAKFDAAVSAHANENKIPYPEAFKIVAAQQPDLYAAWVRGR